MGSRGPKPGFKQARAAQAASAPAPKAAATQPAAASPISDAPVVPVVNGSKGKKPEPQVLSASDRENPTKLSGQALRELAYRRGMAKSTLPAIQQAMYQSRRTTIAAKVARGLLASKRRNPVGFF